MFSALNLKFDEQKLEYYRLVEEASDGNQTSDIKVKTINKFCIRNLKHWTFFAKFLLANLILAVTLA